MRLYFGILWRHFSGIFSRQSITTRRTDGQRTDGQRTGWTTVRTDRGRTDDDGTGGHDGTDTTGHGRTEDEQRRRWKLIIYTKNNSYTYMLLPLFTYLDTYLYLFMYMLKMFPASISRSQVYLYTYIHIYTSIYICIYIYIYIHIEQVIRLCRLIEQLIEIRWRSQCAVTRSVSNGRFE